MTPTNDERPKPGEFVILKTLPAGFLNDLPIEDQHAISEIIGKPILLNEYDEEDRAELQFTDKHGVIHFLYLQADFLKH